MLLLLLFSPLLAFSLHISSSFSVLGSFFRQSSLLWSSSFSATSIFLYLSFSTISRLSFWPCFQSRFIRLLTILPTIHASVPIFLLDLSFFPLLAFKLIDAAFKKGIMHTQCSMSNIGWVHWNLCIFDSLQSVHVSELKASDIVCLIAAYTTMCSQLASYHLAAITPCSR